jgi:DNA-binding GntR family transcriptional regulator
MLRQRETGTVANGLGFDGQTTADRASDRAYLRLKDLILRLELPPGAKLDEASLMERVGVGRTPLREALYRLAGEGLVVVSPRRNFFVPELGIQSVQQLLELRIELELFCARLAAQRITEEEIAALASLIESPGPPAPFESGQALDPATLLDLHCHRVIARAARNQYAEETLTRLHNQTVRLLFMVRGKQETLPEIQRDFREVLQALRERDSEKAAVAMRAHIAQFQFSLLASLLGADAAEVALRSRAGPAGGRS